MKKIFAVICCLFLVFNISFAFDPYADEEPETKSKSKLYWGIFMTLVGGFLAYDGFSQEEVDISKPSVDYGGKINYFFSGGEGQGWYTLYSGTGTAKSEGTGGTWSGKPNEKNKIYNNGNVDLYDVQVWVKYYHGSDNSRTVAIENDKIGYFFEKDGTPLVNPLNSDKTPINPVTQYSGDSSFYLISDMYGTNGVALDVNESKDWQDETGYTPEENVPGGQSNDVYYQENALEFMDVKVTYKYNHKYKKRNKSDIEGVAGLMIATAGIYFIVDYLVDLHKFNQYMRRNDIDIRLANAPNEYKLLFQKRL